MKPNVGVGRGRSTFFSFTANAWVSVAVLIAALLGASLRHSASMPVPILVAVVLAWPSLRTWRAGTFAALLGLWALALVPGWPLHPLAWPSSLGAFTILAAETARDEGTGVPVARFLQSPKVQGWAALVLFPLLSVFGVLAVDRELQLSGIPSAWRGASSDWCS